MPGSLLSPPRSRVSRNESTRSDHSDGSNTSHSSAAGKKVSFSKAVRVKKYSRPKKSDHTESHTNGVPSNGHEKRFWFKVYKNKHRHSPDPKELRRNDVIYYDNNVTRYNGDNDFISYHPNPSPLNYPTLTADSGTQTAPRYSIVRAPSPSGESTELHSSQMPTELPHVRRNHVKKIVNRFNEEAVLARQRSWESDMSPPDSPIMYHSTPLKPQRIPTPPPEPPISYSKSKRNPIANGVKVMFGLGSAKKRDKEPPFVTRTENIPYNREDVTNSGDFYRTNGKTKISEKYPYKSEVVISDGSDTDVKYRYDKKSDFGESKKVSYGDMVPVHPGGLFRHDEETNGRYNDDEFFGENGNEGNKQSKYHVETFDSGNQLVVDTTDEITSRSKLDKGELFSTVGEKHQVWQNNKRIIVVEEPSPRIIRRKAKSQSDLANSKENTWKNANVDKGISTEQLTAPEKYDDSQSKRSKDSWFKLWRTSTKDKGVQCDSPPTVDDYYSGKYKIVKPKHSTGTIYRNVATLERAETRNNKEPIHVDDYNESVLTSTYRNGDIYSLVDKSKKKKSEKKKTVFDDKKNGSLFKSRSEPLYIGPPPRDYRSEDYDDSVERSVKTSKRSFGFRLNPSGDDKKGIKNNRHLYTDEDWYDVDGDVDDIERGKNRRNATHHSISEIRNEIADDDFASDLSSSGEKNGDCPGSVMREVDYKKREISYENVPRPEGGSNLHNSANLGGSGLWFREADEDYRKEMAQNEISYPAGSHVGSDRFYTVSRTDRTTKQKPPSSPRALTLDRHQRKDKNNASSGVKILVNGKEMNEKSGFQKNRSRKSRFSNEDPSSVQSDPMYVRGGLAAAYQARQRAAVRRSNSSVAGLSSNYRTVSPVIRRKYRGTSEVSGASSETETARSRKPLVMYIPGISHPDRSADEDDRSSGVNVARSQSMMNSTRPSRLISRKSNHKSSKQDLYRNQEYFEEDEITPLAFDANKKKPPKVPHDTRKADIKRRHSMPKDTKFPWLKWRIRSKPSREP